MLWADGRCQWWTQTLEPKRLQCQSQSQWAYHVRAPMHEPFTHTHTQKRCVRCGGVVVCVSRSGQSASNGGAAVSRCVCKKAGEIAIRDPSLSLRRRGGHWGQNVLWTGLGSEEEGGFENVTGKWSSKLCLSRFASSDLRQSPSWSLACSTAAVMTTANCACAVKILYHIRLR